MKKYIQNFKLLMFPIYIVSDSVGNLVLSKSVMQERASHQSMAAVSEFKLV